MATNSRIRRRKIFVETSFDKDGYTICQCCFKTFNKSDVDESGNKMITVDHIIPLSNGGTDDYENFMIMCRPCNRKKGSLSLYYFNLFVNHESGGELSNQEKDDLINGMIQERLSI